MISLLIQIYIITTLASIGLTTHQFLSLIKDVVDAGYIFDMEKIKEFSDNEKNASPNLGIKLFWPIVNILWALYDTYMYSSYRDEILSGLNVFDVLRRVPDSLYQEYQKNPSALNALMTLIKDADNTHTIEIPGDEGKSIFKYNMPDDFDTLEILSVQGPAVNLPYYKQKELIKEAWFKVGKQISYEYGSLENFGKSMNKENNIELDNPSIPEISAESAKINSIKLRKIDNENSYFEVELVDEEGNSLGVFGSPYITDSVNFRREVFGLLQACGTNNFLKLGGQENISIPITFKSDERDNVNEIHNGKNQTFHQANDGKYITETTVFDERELFEGEINSITSASGVIEMVIRSPYFTTFYKTGDIYYGFGYPLISSSNDPEMSQNASNHYKEYIENLLEFIGTDDLLKMGGDIQKFPQVLIERDKTGNIIAIGREGEEYHLRIIDNEYKMEKGKLIITDKNKSKKLI